MSISLFTNNQIKYFTDKGGRQRQICEFVPRGVKIVIAFCEPSCYLKTLSTVRCSKDKMLAACRHWPCKKGT